jgi:hypothetical protein
LVARLQAIGTDMPGLFAMGTPLPPRTGVLGCDRPEQDDHRLPRTRALQKADIEVDDPAATAAMLKAGRWV